MNRTEMISALTSNSRFNFEEDRYELIKEFFVDLPVDLTARIDFSGASRLVAMEVVSIITSYGEYAEGKSLVEAFSGWLQR